MKLKVFADDKFNIATMVISVSDREESIVEKGENADYQIFFLSFSHKVFKSLLL